MNTSLNSTLTPQKRRTRAIVMLIASYALSIINILIDKASALAGKSSLTYDPSMLYAVTFTVGAMLLSCAIATLALDTRHAFWTVPLISALAVGGTYAALGASPADILIALIFIPSATVIAACLFRGCEKFHTVAANAVVLAAAFILSALLSHYGTFGELSEISVGYTVSAFRESFLEFYQNNDYSSFGLTLANLHEVFNTFLLLIPSLLCALVAVLSYIEVTLSRAILLGQGASSEAIAHWPFKLSRLASFVFLGASIMTMLSVSLENETLMIITTNLMIVFIPGFFLVGIRSSLMHFKRPGLFGMIFGALAIFACIQNPALLFILVASVGAIDNLFAVYRESLYGEQGKTKNKD